MFLSEPNATALLLIALGVLLGVSVIFSRASDRAGTPVILLFLIIGMLAGSEGVGGIEFKNYGVAFRVGTVALVLILFSGGLNTPLDSIRRQVAPATVLATIGVAATAALMALGVRALGFSWPEALLLGSIVSSTDAAAVFAVLRGSGLHLRKRVGVTLELESGINDPMAVILTMSFAQMMATGEKLTWVALLGIPLQLAVGGLLGVALGYGGRFLVRRVRLSTGGLYPVLTLALAFLAFGLPTLLYGSGFLAVYVAGMVLGSSSLPYQTGLVRVHDSIAWFSQVIMFLFMGLLVSPAQLWQDAGIGLLLGLMLAVARPLAIIPCLLPFHYPRKEMLYIGWIGLRGAVPIILATIPVLTQVEGGLRIFNLVFFMVVVSAFLPGSTVRWLTERLGLKTKGPPPAPAALEIASTEILKGDILPFYIDESSPVSGRRISHLRFPPSSTAMLLLRAGRLIAPRGSTVLSPGDHIYIFCPPEEKESIRKLFHSSRDEED